MSETGSAGACADGSALDYAHGVAVSPDGRNVYVASFLSSALLIFDRDPSTGTLTQKEDSAGCLSVSAPLCGSGVGLLGATSVAVSSDGRNVYVASQNSNAVAIFDRDGFNGELTQKDGAAACVNEDGSSGCTDGVALLTAFSVAVSPDGRNVYVAAPGSDAVAVFDRSLSTGALTQKAGTAACISETGTGGLCTDSFALVQASAVAIGPDGRNAYVTSLAGDSVTVLVRDPPTGALLHSVMTCFSQTGSEGECNQGRALDGPLGVAVSPDGQSVYVASALGDAVAVFERRASGLLTQKAGTAGCINETGSEGCADGRALDNATSVAVSLDSRSVYVASQSSDAVAVFDRDLATGELIQKGGPAGCTSDTGQGGCADGVALDNPLAVAVSPDGLNVYAAVRESDSVAVFDRDAPSFDIDGDGQFESLTDGLLLLRSLFGFTGTTLVAGAVDLAHCTRCTAAEITAFIQDLNSP